MPELPEVETVVRGLRARLLGGVIAEVVIRTPAIVRGARPPWHRLAGARIHTLERAGKYILLAAATPAGEGWQVMIHLGMTGKLLFSHAVADIERHTHVVLHLAGGSELRFVDPRRFGRWALAPSPPAGWSPRLGVAAGAEPLAVGVDDFVALFHHRHAPIKNALLNQKLLRGMGNIYADESLFRAGLHPLARRISRPRLRRLRLCIRAVLREAIAAGGSSISDYVDSAGRRGWFQIRHRVYGRTGEPCARCRTPIRRLVLAGRSAHFCPNCQRR